jgi:predicted Zn-dependent peptidase
MPRVSSTAIGFFVKTGSRHERTHEHGVSHFLEHMCFKGTPRRDWRAINVRFDELGSIYNAFTSKEHTVYYGWVPSDRFEPQLELLSDMMRPSLPPEDFETERNVILEEIAMSGDSFEHHVWNFLHQTIFGDHPLAHEILGEKETIEKLLRQTMADYHNERYAADNVVLIASGAIDADAVFAAAGRYCGDWRRSSNGDRRFAAPSRPATGMRTHRLEQFKQQMVIEVFPSVPHDSDESENIEAFSALFGGVNSRCYWNIVQKGVCSQAGAAWLSYGDCGVMALYADGEPDQAQAMLAALREQAREVSEKGFRRDELQRVKNRRRTHLALEAESPKTRLMQLLDDLETRGCPRSADARLAAVEAVSEQSIADYLRRYPITGEGLLLSCGPRDWAAQAN